MAYALTLESFDDAETPQQLHPEYSRGLDEGIALGRLQAEQAHKTLHEGLVSAIADNGFTFAEARQSVLLELEPLLQAITTQILPATQTIGLATLICETLQSAAEENLSIQPVITIHPDHVDGIYLAIGRFLDSKVTVVTDPSLSTHAAWLNLNGRNLAIDFESTLAAIQTVLLAFSEQTERTMNHG